MKNSVYAFVLLITSFTKINAQFVGYYSLKDGGVDIQNSTLFILPDHTFALIFPGGNPIEGKWIEKSNNKIKLETDTNNKSIFSVFAIVDTESKNNIQFSPLEQLNLYVSFLQNETQETLFQPLFDDDWSCIDRNFEKNIPNKSTLLKLVSPYNGIDFAKEAEYPVTSNVYTFKLTEKQSNYRVFIDPNAKADIQFEIEKQNDDDYIIKQVGRYNSNPIITERNELNDKIQKEIKNALIPWQINDLQQRGKDIKMLSPIKVEKIELTKPSQKPLFISNCK